MRRLKKDLKNNAQNILPGDEARRVAVNNAERNNIYVANDGTAVVNKKFWTNKNITIIAVSCCLIICLVAGALGISYFIGGANKAFSNGGFLSNPTSKNAIALSVGSALQIAGDMESNASMQVSNNAMVSANINGGQTVAYQVITKNGELADQEIVERIDKNIELVENFMDASLNTFVEEKSDREEYSYKATMTVDGEKIVMYYNLVDENGRNNEVQTYDDDDDLDDDDFDFDFDDEQEYVIEGIAISGDKEYPIKGEKETEDGESELEMTIYFDEKTNSERPNNGIVVKQEIENEDGEQEQEFQYTIYQNGKKINDFAISAEKEGNSEEYEYYRIDENKVRESIRYHKVENRNKSMLKINYTKGKDSYKVELQQKVDKNNNQLIKEYKVDGGEKIVIKTPLSEAK